jgi:hypothetical protein
MTARTFNELEILLLRYFCIFGLLIAMMLPLGGCGEKASPPMNEKGQPVDPPEPPAPPREG